MKKLSILTWRLLEGVSIVNLKPTINYNNILIKALFINIVAVSDSETHSERLAYIKDSERYYIVFTLSSWIVLISGSLLRQVILKIFCYQKGFPETPETPPSIRPWHTIKKVCTAHHISCASLDESDTPILVCYAHHIF